MGNEQMDYAAILADLEAKRNALEATIASFRQALALGALGQAGDVSMSSNGSGSLSGSVGNEVPAGAFLGKSIPEAAKLYLAVVKKKQTSKEIAEALKRGGMESTSKNFVGIVHAVMARARKANTGIVKLDRSYWGLADWYHPGLRSTIVPEKRTARKKARKKKEPKALPSASAAPAPPAKGKANERALAYLQGKPHAEHSLAEVGAHLGMGVQGARLVLGKLVKAGKVRMTAPGMYTVELKEVTKYL
jgi:hypothetical protein